MLLTACCGVLSDHYCYETINKFEKLLKQEVVKNISKVATIILLIISMHIEPTKLLEVGPSNTKYDLEERLCKRCTNTNWGDDSEIEKAIAADNNKNNNEKDSQKKIGN